jgi:putative flippase GtrA
MIQSPKVRRELNRFFKFSVVGVIGAIVDFGTFNLLNSGLGLWSVAASTLSFSAAITSNFVWNYKWTYPDSRSKPLRKQAAQFALVNLVGLAIRTPIFAFSEAPLSKISGQILESIPPTLPPGSQSFLPIPAEVLGSNLALALAVIVVLFWNFGVNRVWTYSDVK